MQLLHSLAIDLITHQHFVYLSSIMYLQLERNSNRGNGEIKNYVGILMDKV